jgi:hypothetical protein
VPICKDLSIKRVLELIKDIPEIWFYLPDCDATRTWMVPRAFLFNIINTLDKDFFPEALQ